MVIGEDPDDVAAAFDIYVDPLERVRGCDLAPVASGLRGVIEHVDLGALEDRSGLGKLALEDADDFVRLGSAIARHTGRDPTGWTAYLHHFTDANSHRWLDERPTTGTTHPTGPRSL